MLTLVLNSTRETDFDLKLRRPTFKKEVTSFALIFVGDSATIFTPDGAAYSENCPQTKERIEVLLKSLSEEGGSYDFRQIDTALGRRIYYFDSSIGPGLTTTNVSAHIAHPVWCDLIQCIKNITPDDFELPYFFGMFK